MSCMFSTIVNYRNIFSMFFEEKNKWKDLLCFLYHLMALTISYSVTFFMQTIYKPFWDQVHFHVDVLYLL